MSSSKNPERLHPAQGQARTGPALRLLRLWLFATPLIMMGFAATFAALAAANGRWGLLAAMVVLAVLSVALFIVQTRLLARYQESQRISSGRG